MTIVQKLIIASAMSSENLSVRPYSGRGMFGKNCIGIDTSDGIMETVVTMIETAFSILSMHNQPSHHAYFSEFLSTMKDANIDNMGLDYIVYFPSEEWDDDMNEFMNDYNERYSDDGDIKEFF